MSYKFFQMSPRQHHISPLLLHLIDQCLIQTVIQTGFYSLLELVHGGLAIAIFD